MNIPLNIDFQQILLHLLNFTILAFGLYVLLYKPVKKFMDERTDYYKQLDNQANEKIKDAESIKRTYQSKLSNVDDEIRKIKADARKEADTAVAAQLERANCQAEKIISDARASANSERQKIIASARTDIAQLAADAADKLLNEALKNG